MNFVPKFYKICLKKLCFVLMASGYSTIGKDLTTDPEIKSLDLGVAWQTD